MTSKLKGYRLDSEVERCRTESGFKRLHDLLPQITAKNSGLESLANFLSGEVYLELFLDGFDGFPRPSPQNKDALRKAKKHLLAVFDTSSLQQNSGQFAPRVAHVQVETHLLLAKLYYVCAQYDDALTAIGKAKLDQDLMEFTSLRTLRLVAESYAIKGLCLEALQSSHKTSASTSRFQKTRRDDQVSSCFEKSADYALRYLRELEKYTFGGGGGGQSQAGLTPPGVIIGQTGSIASSASVSGISPGLPTHSQSSSSSFLIGAGGGGGGATTAALSFQTTLSRYDQIGPFISTAVQRVPIAYVKRDELNKGIDYYRNLLINIDKAHCQQLQQILTRQLAEVLLRGVSAKYYKPPHQPAAGSARFTSGSVTGISDFGSEEEKSSRSENQQQINGGSSSFQQQVGGTLTGVRFFNIDGSVKDRDNCFCPENKMEEAYLLLSISETIACKEAVLSRAEDHSDARDRSLSSVRTVNNLLTLVLSGFRQYQLLSEMFERAMKFAYDDRFVWFQFALSLICQAKHTRAESILHEYVIPINGQSDADQVRYLIGAKLCVEQLGLYDRALTLAEAALKASYQGSGWLAPRAHLLIGSSYSLKAQCCPVFAERKLLMTHASQAYERALVLDPNDYVSEFFLALQLAINRNLTEAMQHCRNALEKYSEQPVTLMLLALLLTAENHYGDALHLVEQALEDFPTHYGLLVLRLKLEMKLQKASGALLTAKDLLLFWRLSSFSSSPDRIRSSHVGSTGTGGVLNDTLSGIEPSNRLTMPVPGALGEQSTSNLSSMAPSTGAPPLGGVGQQQAPPTGSVVLPNGVEMTDKESVFSSSRPLTEYGGAVSTISDSLGLAAASNISLNTLTQYRMQANIWLELAELFLNGDDYVDEVQECVEEACLTFPGCHQVLYLKGRLHQRSSRMHEAKACYLGALGSFPNHLPSMRCLAMVYQQFGNGRMAEQVLRELTKNDPYDHQNWFSLGQLLSDSGKYEESCQCLKTAVSLEESSPIMPFSVIPRVIHL